MSSMPALIKPSANDDIARAMFYLYCATTACGLDILPRDLIDYDNHAALPPARRQCVLLAAHAFSPIVLSRVTLYEDSSRSILGRRERFRLVPVDQMPPRFRVRPDVRLRNFHVAIHRVLVHHPSWALRLLRLSKVSLHQSQQVLIRTLHAHCMHCLWGGPCQCVAAFTRHVRGGRFCPRPEHSVCAPFPSNLWTHSNHCSHCIGHAGPCKCPRGCPRPEDEEVSCFPITSESMCEECGRDFVTTVTVTFSRCRGKTVVCRGCYENLSFAWWHALCERNRQFVTRAPRMFSHVAVSPFASSHGTITGVNSPPPIGTRVPMVTTAPHLHQHHQHHHRHGHIKPTPIPNVYHPPPHTDENSYHHAQRVHENHVRVTQRVGETHIKRVDDRPRQTSHMTRARLNMNVDRCTRHDKPQPKSCVARGGIRQYDRGSPPPPPRSPPRQSATSTPRVRAATGGSWASPGLMELSDISFPATGGPGSGPGPESGSGSGSVGNSNNHKTHGWVRMDRSMSNATQSRVDLGRVLRDRGTALDGNGNEDENDDEMMGEYGSSSSVVRLREWWGSGSLGVRRAKLLGRGSSMNITSGVERQQRQYHQHDQQQQQQQKEQKRKYLYHKATSANLTSAGTSSLAQRANLLRRRMVRRKNVKLSRDNLFDHDEAHVPVEKGDRVILHGLDDASSSDEDENENGGIGNNYERRAHTGLDGTRVYGSLDGREGVVVVPQAKPGVAAICLTGGTGRYEYGHSCGQGRGREREIGRSSAARILTSTPGRSKAEHATSSSSAAEADRNRDRDGDRIVFVRYENLRICSDENMTTTKHLPRPLEPRSEASRVVRFVQ